MTYKETLVLCRGDVVIGVGQNAGIKALESYSGSLAARSWTITLTRLLMPANMPPLTAGEEGLVLYLVRRDGDMENKRLFAANLVCVHGSAACVIHDTVLYETVTFDTRTLPQFLRPTASELPTFEFAEMPHLAQAYSIGVDHGDGKDVHSTTVMLDDQVIATTTQQSQQGPSHDNQEASMTLREIYEKTEAAWPFDAENYPNLEHVFAGQRAVAYSGHTLLHVMKQAGKLAALFEPMAHSVFYNVTSRRSEVARQVAYMIVNVLRLAQLAGVAPEDVEDAIQQYVNKEEIPK